MPDGDYIGEKVFIGLLISLALAWFALSGSAHANESLATPAILASASLPARDIYIRSVNGSPCGLLYRPGTTAPTGVYGEVLNSASGIYWEPVYSTSPVRACEFGAVGDGSYDSATGVITGTDNTPMIQAALDYAMQNGLQTACLSDGRYKTTDTLHLGWGETFRSLSLISCGMSRSSFFALQGVTILPTKTDRCALNIQGGRRSGVHDIAFLGQNYPYNAALIGSGNPFPATNLGWLNPSLAASGSTPGGLQQHSPYAAICIDAYAGSSPSAPYPAVAYPAWTALSTQYGKSDTSDVDIDDVQIVGFAVGINSKPNDQGNGDFIKIDKFDCQYTTYCASIGNTQSRNVQFTNVSGTGVFALLTNNQFGSQQGEISGRISNLSLSSSYEFFQFSSLVAMGPQTFDGLYAEAVVRIGSFANGSAFAPTYIFNGANLNFYQNITRVSPAALIEGPVSGDLPTFILNGVSFNTGIGRIETILHGNGNLEIHGGGWQGAGSVPSLFSASMAVAQAVDFTGGFLTGNSATFPTTVGGSIARWISPTNATFLATPTGSIQSQTLGENVTSKWGAGFRGQITQATTGFLDHTNGKQWKFAIGPIGINSLQLSSTTPANVSVVAVIGACDTLTFTYLAYQQASASQANNLAVGDILYHVNSGTIFVITAIDAADGSGNYPITARQMNNMIVNPTTGACVTNNISDPTLSGNTLLEHTGLLNVPTVPQFGTFTTGSPNVTNVTNGDTYSGYESVVISVGDHLWSYPNVYGADASFQNPFGAGNSVVGLGSGTMMLKNPATLSGRFAILPLPVVGGSQ